jgi:hypothetical protein
LKSTRTVGTIHGKNAYKHPNVEEDVKTPVEVKIKRSLGRFCFEKSGFNGLISVKIYQKNQSEDEEEAEKKWKNLGHVGSNAKIMGMV